MKLNRSDERGQSLVEVALAMPLLILIVMGILDLGRAYYAYVTLSDAAAEGAAYAAIHPDDTTQIVERVADTSNVLVAIDPAMVNVDVPDATPGRPITVTVQYDHQILTPIMNSFVPGGKITMTSVVVQAIINP
jgi:Flp pilus assembly protein TadG